jgi:hypothetical protein
VDSYEEAHYVASNMMVKQSTKRYLCFFDRIGTRWIGMFIRLALYALFLMPGFIQGEDVASPFEPNSRCSICIQHSYLRPQHN